MVLIFQNYPFTNINKNDKNSKLTKIFVIIGIIIVVITGPMYFINEDFLPVSIIGIVVGIFIIGFPFIDLDNIDKEKLESIEAKLYAILDEIK